MLGAFEGQPIHPIDYFKTEVSYEDNLQKVTLFDPIIESMFWVEMA